jgi:hypothetical protein
LHTLIQKKYGKQKYGKSLLFYLKDSGLVDSSLVLGYAVFLSGKDIQLYSGK